MLQRLRPKQRDVNANRGATAIWQSLGTCRCDCMEFHMGAQYDIYQQS